MDNYGFLSLIPPIIAIILAIRTKQVFISLLTGIFFGALIIGNWNPFNGILLTIEFIVDVFDDPGNTRVVFFTFLVGSLITLIQVSGGVGGFIKTFQKKFENNNGKENTKKIQLYASVTGFLLFVESNISALTVGTIFRPLFDKLKISREKLAYIADSTSAPSKLLIPFNGWGAYIIGLLTVQGIEKPFNTLINAMKYNFYPILVILLLLVLILTGKDYGLMKKAEKRTKGGILFDKGSSPMVSQDIIIIKTKEGVKENALNMFIPLISMVVIMILMLFYTGYDSSQQNMSFFDILANSSGSSSVLYSVIISIIIASFYYIISGILSLKEVISYSIKGMSGMMQLSLLIILAFTIGNLCKELGTGIYVSNELKDILSPKMVPFLLFITSCFISFSTGTSWGTFAIMLAIAVPISNEMGIESSITIAAALGGGLFGDHCSPISDTSVVSSMASASDHIDHVKTQLPYAMVSGIITAIFYLVIGFWI